MEQQVAVAYKVHGAVAEQEVRVPAQMVQHVEQREAVLAAGESDQNAVAFADHPVFADRPAGQFAEFAEWFHVVLEVRKKF